MTYLSKLGLSRLAALAFVAIVGFAAAQEIPKGEVLKFSFENSKIFPGTYREYSVYIPKQYSPDKPACVHINQDGVQFDAPVVFDELIAKGEMPITIGVFIGHGRVKAADPKVALDRFNRSFEYDGLGDNYARFLLEELLPDVETKKASDGREIKLSKDGNDRCIAGSSSGAVCAFTAAWERPHEFRRVFSAIGTYVGLRGGHEYGTLVRKVEPKAIRIFLQDGSKDQNIYAGDWWMANQDLERSLTFAGYEVNHAWGEGGHDGKHATEIFPDAMRWLWKDYPQPIKAGLGSKQLQELLIQGEGWQPLYEPRTPRKNPWKNVGAASDHEGSVHFSNGRDVMGTSDGSTQIFFQRKIADAQAFGPDKLCYAVWRKERKVVADDAEGKAKPLADDIDAHDLVVLNNGNTYVTESPSSGRESSRVWLVRPSGEKQMVDEGLNFSSGITVSPDQTLLYVSDRGSHWIYSYQIHANGTLAHKQRYYHLHVPDDADDSGADTLRCDVDGRLWVATRMGLQICDQAGRVNCILPTPNGKLTGFCFGGSEFDRVYVCAGDRLFTRQVKVRGANPWDKPIKPGAPRL